MKMNDAQILRMYEQEYVPVGKGYSDLAYRLGITIPQLDHALRRARKAREEQAEEDNPATNEAVISSSEVTTLDELLDLYGVDRNIWEVAKFQANRWEMARKDKSESVTWERGKKDGWSEDSGKLFKTPLYQVKAWLVRKEPIAIHPVVRPIVFKNPVKRYSSSNETASNVSRTLVLPDAQIGFSRNLRTGKLTPFHDRLALSAVVKLAQWIQPHRIIIQGDWLDLPDWQDRFIRGPEFWGVMQPALYEAAYWIHQLLKTTQYMDYLEGNHELRMRTALYTHLQSAYDLRQVNSLGVVVDAPSISIPGLLSLNELGVNWHDGYPNNKIWLNDFLAVEHGASVGGRPGATATKLLENRNHSSVFAHVHRAEFATSFVNSRNERRVIQAMCPGTLSRIDNQVPGNTERQNWNQGVVVAFHDDGPEFVLAHCPIYNGTLHFNAVRIEGEDSTEEIESAEGVGFF